MPIAPGSLENFTCESFEHKDAKYDIYHIGNGPGVVILHELLGLTPEVLGLAERIAAQGFHVVVPCLFGKPGQSGHFLTNLIKVCIRKEFNALAANKTGTIVEWLRALCSHVYHSINVKNRDRNVVYPGVGVIGMCLTGNYALALVVDAEAKVMAPVMSQPSLPASSLGPFSFPQRQIALHLSPDDLTAIKNRMQEENLTALGLRFSKDKTSPCARFARLRHELGPNFQSHEIDSSECNAFAIPRSAHSVLTHDFTDEPGHPTREALDYVTAFLKERLRPIQI
jgi:dienelactone hydrolase